ncbi:MAG: hypothetical protein SFW67_10980 [Myxococcaceae bacterium]|nr:hypothetical protein [Myxococcaceae bacterium]
MFLPLALVALSSGCLPEATSSPQLNGRHQRVVTAQGPVHLWCPTGAAPELLVVYVHGYYDTVDDAYRDHGLIEQFSRSGVNALFVLIDGPTGPQEPVRWTTFRPLLTELRRTAGDVVPTRVMAMGHSGGNRTLREWTKEGVVTDLVLLDAFYGNPAPWTAFLEKQPEGRVELVGALTSRKAEGWRAGLPRTSRARVVQVTAGTDHMGVVTDGVWIPRLVRARFGLPSI